MGRQGAAGGAFFTLFFDDTPFWTLLWALIGLWLPRDQGGVISMAWHGMASGVCVSCGAKK
ncbi:hypothetical protein IWX90DRAFT_437534 [Phyllosticta citrichinensis]|uniref:Uncharacterized protein n=1 Tax=Phyllosticta citrichinensis TaxID=1130410 RepID=A0ABR1XMH6_9PEZI